MTPRRTPLADTAWRVPPRLQYSGGNEVTLLRGGDALFPAMAAAIAAARHEVWLATYIFYDDASTATVLQALADAAQRGVHVYVVLDGFGGMSQLPHLRRRLEPTGVKLTVFRPLERWWQWLQPGQLRRLHQKLCVVDGECAFVGGINMVDDRYDVSHGPTEAPRLDFAVALRGTVVAAVEQAARAVWSRAQLGRDIREEMAALARTAEPLARARRLLNRVRMPAADDTPPEPPPLPPMHAAFVLRDNFRQRRTIERSYVDAMRSAQRRIDIVSPYFYPGRAFRRVLRQAAKRGVQVRLLLQGKIDYRIAGLAARALYDELLGHGVRIYEYTPAYLHAKVAIVDDDWATVGSSNIDPLSLLLNLEANVVVRDAVFAAGLSAQFDEAIAASRDIDPQQALGGGVIGAARRALVAWCAYVYLRMAGVTGRY